MRMTDKENDSSINIDQIAQSLYGTRCYFNRSHLCILSTIKYHRRIVVKYMIPFL